MRGERYCFIEFGCRWGVFLCKCFQKSKIGLPLQTKALRYSLSRDFDKQSDFCKKDAYAIEQKSLYY